MKLEIGQTAFFSKTIAESDVYSFAGIVGDFNSIHINKAKGEESIFNDRVAHGMLVGSLISTVLGTKLPGENTIYLEQNLKFLLPVYFNDTVTARVTVSDVINQEKGIYRLDTVVANQRNEIVVDGYAVVKYKEGTTEQIGDKKNIGHNVSIANTAVIHEDVEIEDDVVIHDFVVLYPGVIIKKGTEIYDHCVIGKLPTTPGSTAKSYSNKYGKTIIGEQSILCPGTVIYTNSSIGHNTLLGDNCSIREDCKIGNYCIISRNVTVNYETTIGNRTKIMDGTHITGNMSIGDNCFISVLVSSTNDNSMGRDENALDHLSGPIVEDNVTIGAGASLLPGVRIGKNAIVGAAALVTKDVAQSKVVMGVPAKVVRDVTK